MTPADVLNRARGFLNDTDSEGFRQGDEELLRYVVDALSEVAILAPQLFYSTGDFQCAQGTTEQSVSFADVQALAEVIKVKGGRAITPCDMATLSAFNPDWGNDPEGPALHWFRHEGDPLRFYIYPMAPAGQIIELKYVRNPKIPTALDQEITDLSPTFVPILAMYVVAKAETKDDEHVNSNRAAAAYQSFLSLVKP